MFIHPQVCAHYGEHIAAARQRGPNILARTAWVSDAPFTITECMRENRPTEMERWVIRLLRKFGIRDGLYCPVNGWVVFFWSPKVLRLTLRDRGCLNAAAVQASLRLDEIIPMPKHERPVRLSARELAVLHYLSIGASDAQIARDLAISEGAIRSYLVRAQKKLGVKTREHAIADAFRRKLIK
jgi:DNA-binding CsgD family transcriptional regulator